MCKREACHRPQRSDEFFCSFTLTLALFVITFLPFVAPKFWRPVKLLLGPG